MGSRRISSRAFLEFRRSFSICELARMESLLISVVILRLRAALVFLFMFTSLASALAMRVSPFLTASRTAALSSALLAFMIAASWARPLAFLIALARTMPVSLSIFFWNLWSLCTTVLCSLAIRDAKSFLQSRRESAMSRRARRVMVARRPFVFICSRSLFDCSVQFASLLGQHVGSMGAVLLH